METVWVGKLTGAEGALLGSATLVGVQELYLTNAEAAAVTALAGSPVLPSLRLLDLMGGGPPAAPGVYDALFGSPGLAGLLGLSVGGFRPGDAVAAAVAGSTCVPSLVSLTLSGTRPGAAGVARLAAAPFARLTALNLRHCGIGDAGLRELLRGPLARNLQELDLGYCKLGPAAALLLAGSDGLRSVRELRLDGNTLTADGLRALGSSPHAVSLTAIDLPDDRMPAAEWRAIRRLPVFARVADAAAFALKGGPDYG